MSGGSSAEDGGSAASGWDGLADGLIAGVHHTLNNRLAALSAVAQVLAADLPEGHPLSGAMSGELQRLERTVSMLALLVGDGGAEPVMLGAVVEEARLLFEQHHALRDLGLEAEVPADLHPLWIPPAVLRRALLLVLAAVGEGTPRGGGVAVTADGDAARVAVAVRSVPGEGAFDVGGEADAAVRRGRIEAAAALLGAWGGGVAEDGGEGVVRMTLLTLAEWRRREGS